MHNHWGIEITKVHHAQADAPHIVPLGNYLIEGPKVPRQPGVNIIRALDVIE